MVGSGGEPVVTPEIFVGDGQEVVDRVVDEVRREMTAAIADRGRAAIALSGGSVATRCFPALAAIPLDWPRCEFFWADERAVPPDDEESNYRLARDLWLAPAGVPPERVHRMPADEADLPAAARAHEATLRQVLGAAPVLDLALLGMGPDGHVASLFPGHPALLEHDRLVLAIEDSPKPPPRRLTLTMPVLTAARRVLLVVFGASKAVALDAAVHDPHSTLPAAQVLRRAPRALALADHDAATRI
jgi:6-phosphogluconolactonase